MTFDLALPEILREEGGYVNDPDDPGGATNKGITQGTFDAYRKAKKQDSKAVRYISQSEVSAIYWQNYWVDGKCELMPIPVALVHFDFAVNAGIGQAARTLQKVLGVAVDGKIGPVTLNATFEYGERKLVTDYSEARRIFYRGLAKSKPVLAKFLKGWLIRVDRIERKALNSIK